MGRKKSSIAINGNRLKDSIKKHGYTQAQFAKKCGVTRETINKMISKNYVENFSLLDKICGILNIHDFYFLIDDNGEDLLPEHSFFEGIDENGEKVLVDLFPPSLSVVGSEYSDGRLAAVRRKNRVEYEDRYLRFISENIDYDNWYNLYLFLKNIVFIYDSFVKDNNNREIELDTIKEKMISELKKRKMKKEFY